MRIVIQRVAKASVSIEGNPYSSISEGLLVLIGIFEGDTEEDVKWLARKCVSLRIFNDDKGIMNRSVNDVKGEILAVSQFTLCAMTAKGNRPSYIRAASHELAIPLYEMFCNETSGLNSRETKRGVFGADMQVSLINDGPVTIIIDSKNRE